MEEDKIEAFFREMKQSDEQLAIPSFQKQKRTRRLPSFLYAAAAAVTALVIVAYLVRQGSPARVQPGEVIILVYQVTPKTHSLMDAQEQSLSEWESPTDYLSADLE
jgi:prolipoprotein diacylglyceryltransferase